MQLLELELCEESINNRKEKSLFFVTVIPHGTASEVVLMYESCKELQKYLKGYRGNDCCVIGITRVQEKESDVFMEALATRVEESLYLKAKDITEGMILQKKNWSD